MGKIIWTGSKYQRRGLPPHPPLRPLRRHGSSPQHRAHPPIACCVRGLAPKRARRGRQRDRNTFACAPMSMLRRPDDHRRDIRRRAARAVFIAEPDQDRHLMIDVALLSASQRRSLSPPRAPEQEGDVLTRSPVLLQAPRPRPPLTCSPSKTLVVFAPTDKTGRLRPPQPRVRSVRDLQIPIARPQPNRAPSSPRFPPYEAFERRPPVEPRAPAKAPPAGVSASAGALGAGAARGASAGVFGARALRGDLGKGLGPAVLLGRPRGSSRRRRPCEGGEGPEWFARRRPSGRRSWRRGRSWRSCRFSICQRGRMSPGEFSS